MDAVTGFSRPTRTGINGVSIADGIRVILHARPVTVGLSPGRARADHADAAILADAGRNSFKTGYG